MNARSTVQKDMGPSEQAILANIGSLLQELQGGSAAAPAAGPAVEPDDDEGFPAAPGVSKGSEQGRTPAEPQSATAPAAPAPKDKGMAPWQEGDDVKKAFRAIAKAIVASDSEGPIAQDPAEERTEETSEENEENIKAVEKKLAALFAGKRTVAKSMASSTPSVDLSPIMNVLKSMNDRISQQGQVIGEILGGLGVEPAAPVAPAAVAKSQGGINSLSLEEIVMSVAKGLSASTGVNQVASGAPVAKGWENQPAHADLDQFSEQFAQDSGWGIRQ